MVTVHELMADSDLAFCFVLAAFTTWCFSSVSMSTFFLIIGGNLGKFVLDFKPSHVIHAAAQRFPDKVEADTEAGGEEAEEDTRPEAALPW